MITTIVRFIHKSDIRWGIVHDTKISLLPSNYATTEDLLKDRDSFNNEEVLKQEEKINISDVTLLSPVTNNCRVICQGANYRQHMKESGMDPDSNPFNMFFNKSSASICSATDSIVKPSHVSLLDYEIEMGLVIGKEITESTEITRDNLSEFIAGVVITNDVSARDVQIPETQFFKGKSYRTFCPVGPYLCLLDKDSIHYLDELHLELRVNGDIRQNDNTKNLVFKPAETLSELSTFSNLDVGDLILTGTPSGCALRIPPPFVVRLFSLIPEPSRWTIFKKIQKKRTQYLQKGDVIETTIFSADKCVDLGSQKNTVT